MTWGPFGASKTPVAMQSDQVGQSSLEVYGVKLMRRTALPGVEETKLIVLGCLGHQHYKTK
jgi:hypothetical protein